MPSTSAARRASRASSSEQHPRAPLRWEAGDWESARCTPVTSWPASTARAAATAESTPPDMAASSFTPASPPDEPGPRHDAGQGLDEGVDVFRSRRVAEREAQRRAGPLLVGPHREEHV